MLRVARAFAATDERNYVTPDDIKAVAAPVFTHRMALTAEAELRGVRVENVLADIIDDVPVPRHEKLSMLTRSGLGAVLAAVILAAAGWWWNYEEVLARGSASRPCCSWRSGCPNGRCRATVSRRIVAVHVPRGDPVLVSYRLRNATAFRSGRATIIDRCDDVEVRTAVSSVAPHVEIDVDGQIPTHRRGLFPVGPFEIERIDPFWLTVGRRRDTQVASVIVHPKVYDLVGPQGAVRVVENESVLRRATADPMSGFVSMRGITSRGTIRG